MAETRPFSSESVTRGHPDKLADQISDAILDNILKHDKNGRVACETFLPNSSTIIVGGEITTNCWADIGHIVRDVVREAGYTKQEYGLCHETVAVMNLIKPQSPDISQGVTEGEGMFKEQGAGDQGMMFGFAIAETPSFMPITIETAHKLVQRLEYVRKKGLVPYLGPDGKSQVTFEFNESGKPLGISTIVISSQHSDGISHETIESDIIQHVINPVCGDRTSKSTRCLINPTGSFVTGGPTADTGLTGRKIIVDTYGGGSLLYPARHGGGAFSGKDPSKVDRSAAYAARYIAKNIVASGTAYAAEVQLAYAIGFAEPVSVMVNTFGTGKIEDTKLEKIVRDNFPLKPKDIIDNFGLKRPLYLQTAAYGHFGNKDVTWEATDKKGLFISRWV